MQDVVDDELEFHERAYTQALNEWNRVQENAEIRTRLLQNRMREEKFVYGYCKV